MSEELLKALMQLFALASDVDDINDESREIVKRYLEIELNQELLEKYITDKKSNEEIYYSTFRGFGVIDKPASLFTTNNTRFKG